MVFIDGTWLYSSQRYLSESYGKNINIDYGKLPRALAARIAEQLSFGGVDIVRTYLFGSNAKNYLDADEEMVGKRRMFYDILREEYNYEVETYYIDYRQRRLRRKDRDPDDDFTPAEKCVDIALASSMLYNAALPFAYEIAILVGGDRDYIPMLQKVRRLGKRVAIASIRQTCSYELQNPKDRQGIRDFDVIWLEDMIEEIQLRQQLRQVHCESPLHEGIDLVWTDEFVRKNRPYFCRTCRERMREIRETEGAEAVEAISRKTRERTQTGGSGSYEGIRGRHFEPMDRSSNYGRDPEERPTPDAPEGAPTATTTEVAPENGATTAGTEPNFNTIDHVQPDRPGPDVQVRPRRPRVAQQSYEKRSFVYQPSQNDYEPADDESLAVDDLYSGKIKKLAEHHGFITTPRGDFYFNSSDMADDCYFDDLRLGTHVEFVVTKLPNRNLRGGAGNGNAVDVDLLD